MIEKCDTCDDLVDLASDPLFHKHNHLNYVRHVFLSHEREDAIRIVQEHINALSDEDGPLRRRGEPTAV